MEQIIDKDGKVIQQSKNLRGIRSYVGKNRIDHVTIQLRAEGKGFLRIDFKDRSSFSTFFASYAVLCCTLRNWRNLYGANLYTYHGMDHCDLGKIEYHNEYLCLQGTW